MSGPYPLRFAYSTLGDHLVDHVEVVCTPESSSAPQSARSSVSSVQGGSSHALGDLVLNAVDKRAEKTAVMKFVELMRASRLSHFTESGFSYSQIGIVSAYSTLVGGVVQLVCHSAWLALCMWYVLVEMPPKNEQGSPIPFIFSSLLFSVGLMGCGFSISVMIDAVYATRRAQSAIKRIANRHLNQPFFVPSEVRAYGQATVEDGVDFYVFDAEKEVFAPMPYYNHHDNEP